FSSYVEYKMGIARAEFSDPVFEHAKHQSRRRGLIDFFREVVFQQNGVQKLLDVSSCGSACDRGMEIRQ
ncbi:MAG: hypothetical protein Q8J76_04510, partial [Desulfobulbaceae bacterium]|nr:hypothetical protein [Desulfobulbaceae bacterium]